MNIRTLRIPAFLFILALLPFAGQAQFVDSKPLEVGIFGGLSTYNGDLQEKNFTYQQSHAAIGLFLSKEIHQGFGLEFGVNFGKLSGADSLASDSSQALRNLDFQSNILDVHLLFTYNFLHNMDTRVTPYAFIGVAVYHFDPYTYYTNDSVSQRYYLQPLHTEGQGLKEYPDRKPYGLTQFSIPFGVGVKYAISPTVNIGAVISMRKTFNDYIDDVSSSYVDNNTLATEYNAASAELAFRTDELPGHENDPYPADGNMRGNPDNNDFYFFTGLKLSISLRSKTRAQQRALEQVACPPSY